MRTKTLLIACLLLTAQSLLAQTDSAADLYQKGRRFMYESDYTNALLVLKQAAEKNPRDVNILNDLGLTYFMMGQYKEGYNLMRPVAESKVADDRTYQVTAMLLRGGKNVREAEMVYRLGLKEFPNSGPLLADYGEFLFIVDPASPMPLALWERGIASDPSYMGNYYHAARAYAKANRPVWAILYGEIFINLESYTTRTVEVKELLLETYKRVFALEQDASLLKNPFEQAVLQHLNQLKSLASSGVTPEALTAIRARFVLDWFKGPQAARYPFALFDHQRYMLRNGVFDAYNQWLFTYVANLPMFQNWTRMNPEEYVAFNQVMRNRLFVQPSGQHYQQ